MNKLKAGDQLRENYLSYIFPQHPHPYLQFHQQIAMFSNMNPASLVSLSSAILLIRINPYSFLPPSSFLPPHAYKAPPLLTVKTSTTFQGPEKSRTSHKAFFGHISMLIYLCTCRQYGAYRFFFLLLDCRLPESWDSAKHFFCPLQRTTPDIC